MTITDEMIKKASDAYWATPSYGSLRAALEAVAPMLIAQGLREAADICDDLEKGSDPMDARFAILVRAQELDPK